MNLTTWVLVSLMAATLAAQSSSPPAPTSAQAPQQPAAEPLPVSIERIQRVLSQPQTIDPDGVSIFRVEVFGQKPNLEDYLGKEFWKGSAPGAAAMSHQDFLAMVTPPEARGMAVYSQGEAIGLIAMSVVAQWALDKLLQRLEKAMQKAHNARKIRAREEARREVQQALAALVRARAAAGLPPRSP